MNVVRGSLPANVRQALVRMQFCVVVALIVLAHRAEAQATINSPYRFIDQSQSFGIWGGAVSSASGTVDIGPQGGPMLGLRYGIRLSGPFTVEADVAYFPSTRAVRDSVVVNDEREQIGEADINLALGMATLRFNLTGPRTWHRLQPFVAFGGGATVDLSGSTTQEEALPAGIQFDYGTSFAGHFGGGIEWFPSDRLSVRLDARNVLWKIPTPVGFLGGPLGLETPEDEWVQNGVFTLGLS
ncbi:MAG: outer membrane beta-barrel protein, partial [Longimicrobiales bacterium]